MAEEKKEHSELKIEYIELSALKPFHKNARFHSERNVEDIQRSIAHFGWVNPVVVRRQDNMIIAGHGRVEAAKAEGLEQVPVIFVDFSENDAALFSVADNRVAETSAWDTVGLKDLMQSFGNMEDMDISVTGFGQQEIAQLFAEHGGNQDLWKEMPEFHQEDTSGIHLTMHFETREAATEFGELIGQEITKTTRYLWYPKKAFGKFTDDGYDDSEEVAEETAVNES